jgi:hypothetical protein
VPLLDSEGVVKGEGQAQKPARRPQEGEKGETRADRSEPPPQGQGFLIHPTQAAQGQEGKRGQDLDPAADDPEAVAVPRVGQSGGHLLPPDAEPACRLRAPAGVEGVAPVEGGEPVLHGLLAGAEQKEEGQKGVHVKAGAASFRSPR